MQNKLINKAYIFVTIPSFIWTVMGIAVCYFTNGKWYNYVAAILPCFLIIITYLITYKSKIARGILLIIGGLLISELSIKFLPLAQIVLVISVFASPLIISGIMYIFTWLKKYTISI